jgi:2-haloalkanoic acid dehalogenase type II
MTPPTLLTFDIFGTVLDWRRGLREALLARGVNPEAAAGFGWFDAVVDAQGADEQEPPFRTYREITARSLVKVLGLGAEEADAIGATVGTWPLFADSRVGMARLLKLARCAATTNSDLAHGAQVRTSFGHPLSGWICAEEVRCYKPAEAFFREAGRRLGAVPGKSWWHVSAYADYDLGVARSLGLTTVFVRRPHARPAPADLEVRDLAELAARVEATAPLPGAPSPFAEPAARRG